MTMIPATQRAMPPCLPHQLLFIVFSFPSSTIIHCMLASSNPKKLCSHPRPFNLNHSMALEPRSELDKEILAFKSMFFVSTAFTGGVNSATRTSAFCFHSPLASLDLTSEMKAADLTGVLKGSSCRNWNRFPSSQLVIMCQEICKRNPVNILLSQKPPKES